MISNYSDTINAYGRREISFTSTLPNRPAVKPLFKTKQTKLFRKV
jgi:hypothetical protein